MNELRDEKLLVTDPADPSVCSPIHEDDIFAHTPGLLAAASVPATITNWGGDPPIDLRELGTYVGEFIGEEAKFVESGDGIHQYELDTTRRTELAGPSTVDWHDGAPRTIAARHPDRELRDL